MPAKRKPRPKGETRPVPVLLLLPSDVVRALDEHLIAANEGRWPPLSRSEVLRAVIAEAVREKRLPK